MGHGENRGERNSRLVLRAALSSRIYRRVQGVDGDGPVSQPEGPPPADLHAPVRQLQRTLRRPVRSDRKHAFQNGRRRSQPCRRLREGDGVPRDGTLPYRTEPAFRIYRPEDRHRRDCGGTLAVQHAWDIYAASHLTRPNSSLALLGSQGTLERACKLNEPFARTDTRRQ